MGIKGVSPNISSNGPEKSNKTGRSFWRWVKNAFFTGQSTMVVTTRREKLNNGFSTASVVPARKAFSKEGTIWNRLFKGRFARIAETLGSQVSESNILEKSLKGRVTVGGGWFSRVRAAVSRLFSLDSTPIRVGAPKQFFSTKENVDDFLKEVKQDSKNITRLVSQEGKPIAFYVQTVAAAEACRKMGFDYKKQIGRGFFEGGEESQVSHADSTSGDSALFFLLNAIQEGKIEKNADTQALVKWYVLQGIHKASQAPYWESSVADLAQKLGISLE